MSMFVKTLCTVAVAALAQAGYAGEPGKLHITGSVEGTADTVVAVTVDMATYSAASMDTFLTKNGKMDIVLPLKEVTYVMLTNVRNGSADGRMRIVAVPGEECAVSGDWHGEYFLGGSEFYESFNMLDSVLTPIQREDDALNEECRRMMADGMSRDSVGAYYRSKASVLRERMLKTQMDFIKANPKNEACAGIIAELPVENVYEAYGMLDASVRNGRMATLLKPALAAADKEKARKEQEKSIQPGMPAPDFTLNDINGKPLSVSSLRGKYLVLDFWGSWCGWCIKGFPEMKRYYEKYSGKMEILGIDCNDTEEKWKDAVNRHGLPWKHVYNPRTSDVCARYAIRGYPTKIVVDPDGNITKVVVGEDPAFYTYLDGLFK